MLNITFEASLLKFSEGKCNVLAQAEVMIARRSLRDSEEMFCCSGVSGGC